MASTLENETSPPSPTTPGSPLTPTTGQCSSGSTCVESDAVRDAIETTEKDLEFDAEAQRGSRRQSTFTESLKRASSSLSKRIPPHWRPNNLSEERNSQRIDDHPVGYPRLAAVMNSDENFLLCRRYSILHTRIMLYRQAELAELEKQLFELDGWDHEDDVRLLKCVDYLDQGENAKLRTELVRKIDEKLKEYNDVVMRLRGMRALPDASKRNYSSVYNWISSNAPLVREDHRLFKEDADFAALVDPREAVSLDGLIEDCLSMVPCKLTKFLFSSPEQRVSTDDRLVHLYSKRRIDAFVRMIITCLAVALLIAPTVVLFTIAEKNSIKILVILLFTLFFSVVLAIFTKAQRHEVFAATAAYCAVLVVFLGGIVTGTNYNR